MQARIMNIVAKFEWAMTLHLPVTLIATYARFEPKPSALAHPLVITNFANQAGSHYEHCGQFWMSCDSPFAQGIWLQLLRDSNPGLQNDASQPKFFIRPKRNHIPNFCAKFGSAVTYSIQMKQNQSQCYGGSGGGLHDSNRGNAKRCVSPKKSSLAASGRIR